MPTPELPHGIYPYLVTPVDGQGNVDQTMVERLVTDLVAAGVNGVAPLGSTGEVMYLTAGQRLDIVGTTIRAAAGDVPVVAGVAAFSTYDAVEQAKAYVQLGCDGLVVMRQHGFATPEAGVVEYFASIAQAVPSCPIVLYTNPVLLGSDLSIQSLVELSAIDNIRYVKDATGDTGRILSMVNRLEGQLEVFSASGHIPLFVFTLGGVGWMSGPACAIPQAAAELYSRFRSGDLDGALELQRRMWPINEAFRRYPLGGCIKAALQLRGYEVGDPIPPQRPLDEAARAEIAAGLEAVDRALGGDAAPELSLSRKTARSR